MRTATADAVVIGGGIIGTSITYHLAKLGLRVELVERGNIAGETSSACADALVLQTKAPGPKLAMASRSVQMYHRLSEELDYDLEFRNEGGMIAALNESELDYVNGLVAKLRAGGVPVELLDTKSARDIQPALTPRALAATYCALDCHLNPLKVSAGFARAAERLGARIRRHTEATGIETGSGRVSAVLTTGGRIPTRLAVNAAGAWSPAVAAMAGIQMDLLPRRGQILVSEPLPPLVRGRLFGARYLMSKLAKPVAGADGGSGYLSGMVLGQQASGNFLIGGTREFVGFDRSTTYHGITDLARQAVELMPALRDMQIIRVFAGLRPAPASGLPTIQRYSEPDGFIVASGHEGDGICLAPVTGEIVAEIAAGRVDDYHQYLENLNGDDSIPEPRNTEEGM